MVDNPIRALIGISPRGQGVAAFSGKIQGWQKVLSKKSEIRGKAVEA